jgi:hypothetical protein
MTISKYGITQPLIALLNKPKADENISPDKSYAIATLRPRRSLQIFASILSIGWIWMSIVISESSQFEGNARIVVAIVLASPVFFMLNALRRRIRLCNEGIELFSQWTGVRKCAWSALTKVKYREWGGQSLLLYPTGWFPIIVPLTMTGIDELERLIRSKAPSVECDDAFRKYRDHITSL